MAGKGRDLSAVQRRQSDKLKLSNRQIKDVTPDPPRDANGDYKRALRQHALRIGRPFVDVLDEWHGRADAYSYSGIPVDEANAAAMRDMLILVDDGPTGRG